MSISVLLQLAPEVLRSMTFPEEPERNQIVYHIHHHPNIEADVYSLGMILYQILYQIRPFEVDGIAKPEGYSESESFSIVDRTLLLANHTSFRIIHSQIWIVKEDKH